LRRFGRVHVGVFVAAGARLVDVEGTTSRGQRGSLRRTVPALSLGPELRVGVVRWLDVRMAVGADMSLHRQRFTVNDDLLLDLRTVRAVADLGVVITPWKER
jgi:hypothetical protein